MKPIILKKYNNRRLYDFSTCRYTVLDRVRQLVRRGTPFRVIDTKGRNILPRTLVEAMLDNPRLGRRHVPALKKLIRA